MRFKWGGDGTFPKQESPPLNDNLLLLSGLLPLGLKLKSPPVTAFSLH